MQKVNTNFTNSECFKKLPCDPWTWIGVTIIVAQMDLDPKGLQPLFRIKIRSETEPFCWIRTRNFYQQFRIKPCHCNVYLMGKFCVNKCEKPFFLILSCIMYCTWTYWFGVKYLRRKFNKLSWTGLFLMVGSESGPRCNRKILYCNNGFHGISRSVWEAREASCTSLVCVWEPSYRLVWPESSCCLILMGPSCSMVEQGIIL